MREHPFFHCYQDDLLAALMGLNDELAASYTKLLLSMYSTLSPIENDARLIARLLGKRPQDARRIVARLMLLGKLELDAEGRLHNGRADAELTRIHGKLVKRMTASLRASLTGSVKPSSEPKRRTKTTRARDRARSGDSLDSIYISSTLGAVEMPRNPAPDARQAQAEPKPVPDHSHEPIVPSSALLNSRLVSSAKPSRQEPSSSLAGSRLIDALNRRKAEQAAKANGPGMEGQEDEGGANADALSDKPNGTGTIDPPE